MIKNYPTAVFEEIKLLARFPEKSQLEGIKIHQDADPVFLASAKSLFDKGLISQPDGGYLTDSGLEAVHHLHHILAALS